jgi:hypothetical protein
MRDCRFLIAYCRLRKSRPRAPRPSGVAQRGGAATAL